MATTDVAMHTPASTQPEQVAANVVTADQGELTPYERIVARMKGTGRIVGDIISIDPEPWDCEVE